MLIECFADPIYLAMNSREERTRNFPVEDLSNFSYGQHYSTKHVYLFTNQGEKKKKTGSN